MWKYTTLKIHYVALWMLPVCALAADDFSFPDDELVITPTKLLQSMADSPAPVTIIERAQMKRLGIRSIAEALRMVPGMAVGYTSGNEYRINFHGTNGSRPRRMQVLLDGVSIYRNTIATVDWETIPVHVEDIERIEVTRAPSGATYGTNSFMAVVNIITRHPEDNQVKTLDGLASGRGVRDYYAKYSGQALDGFYYTSVRHSETDGFDRITNSGFTGPYLNSGNDFINQNQFNIRYNKAISESATLDTSLSLVDKAKGNLQQDSTGILPTEEVGQDIFYRLNVEYRPNDDHEIDFNFNYVSNEENTEFNACFTAFLLTPELRALYQLNPDLALTFASGTTPTGNTTEETALINDVLARIAAMGPAATQQSCGRINLDDKDTRIDYAISDTFVISDSLRMISGLNVSTIEFDSAYHLGGTISNNRYSIYNNTEFKPVDAITINAGILGEVEEDYLDEEVFWSPRLALNYHITPASTLRFAVTRSYRTPDLFERESDWQIRVTNLNPPVLGSTEALHFFAVTGTPDLLPEKIVSKEIGLYSQLPGGSLMVDVKLYQEKLTDVIANGLSPIFTNLTNDDAVTLEGIDTNVKYKATDSLDLNVGYAYQDSDSTTPLEESMYARHSGFISAVNRLSPHSALGTTIYATSNLTGNRYARADIALTGDLYRTADMSIEGGVIARYQKHNEIVVNTGDFTLNFENDSRWQLLAGLQATF